MKTIKNIVIICFVIVFASLAMILVSCGEKEENELSDQTYKVTVKDSLGKPYSSGIIVRFMQNEQQIAMQPCNENGVAEKTLAKGEYAVSLDFTSGESNYHYNKYIVLTEKENEVDVILSNKITSEPETLHVGSNEYDSYVITEGCTYLELNESERNYFLFTPTRAGNYKFSVADGSNAEIGYYGAPHFVQEISYVEVKDKSFTISVSASMIGTGDSGTSVYVIGIDSVNNTKNCIFAIERIGDAVKTVEDEPWTIYEKTAELSDYKLPENAQIKEFDLTASTDTYKLVYNESDGFYHLNSVTGPLVLVRLSEDTDYIACFETILDRSGVVKYFYDENGEFEKRESYSECLLEYIEYTDDAEGVYPLTEDLKYIIQQRGDYVGWWDIESNGYLFKDDNGNNMLDINSEIAWLLMCCYAE